MFRRFLRERKGTSTIEMAIVLPVLMLVTLGVIEAGFYIYNNHLLNRAVREGARYCSLYSTGDTKCTTANVSTVIGKALKDSGGKSLLVNTTYSVGSISKQTNTPTPGNTTVVATINGTYTTLMGTFIFPSATINYKPVTTAIVADW